MKETTLCFIVRDGKVLLGMKKRGFGSGKWNGFGGKLAEGEDPKRGVAREIAEEAGIAVDPAHLRDAGSLTFTFKDNPSWDNHCHLFAAEDWTGEPGESDEMRPAWHSIRDLPFEQMWADDPHWVPLVLAGKRVEGRFFFDESGDELINFAVSAK